MCLLSAVVPHLILKTPTEVASKNCPVGLISLRAQIKYELPKDCVRLASSPNLPFISRLALEAVSRWATIEHFGPNSWILCLHVTGIVWGRNCCSPEGPLFSSVLCPKHTAPYRRCFLVPEMAVNGNVTFGEVNLRAIKLKMEWIL